MYSNDESIQSPGLAKRLATSYAIGFITLLAALFITLYFSIETILNKDIDDDLREDIEQYQQMYITSGLQKVIEELEIESSEEGGESEFIRLFNIAGNTYFESDLSSWQEALSLLFPKSIFCT